jgi:acid stress chaperone HdeA
MKPRSIAFAVVFAVASAPALAASPPKKPLTQWTCEEFLAVDDTFRPKVVYWATAYGNGGKPESATIDVDGIETVTPRIIDACVKVKTQSFWRTLKNEWKSLEAAAKKDVKKVEKAM